MKEIMDTNGQITRAVFFICPDCGTDLFVTAHEANVDLTNGKDKLETQCYACDRNIDVCLSPDQKDEIMTACQW